MGGAWEWTDVGGRRDAYSAELFPKPFSHLFYPSASRAPGLSTSGCCRSPELFLLGINQPNLCSPESHFKLVFQPFLRDALETSSRCALAAPAGQGHRGWEGVPEEGRNCRDSGNQKCHMVPRYHIAVGPYLREFLVKCEQNDRWWKRRVRNREGLPPLAISPCPDTKIIPSSPPCPSPQRQSLQYIES